MYICFGVTLAIRLVSIKFNWHLDTVNTAAEAGSEKAMEGKENVREKNEE